MAQHFNPAPVRRDNRLRYGKPQSVIPAFTVPCRICTVKPFKDFFTLLFGDFLPVVYDGKESGIFPFRQYNPDCPARPAVADGIIQKDGDKLP